MVPTRDSGIVEALHEPSPGIESLPWESGAEDARTPNADALSADLAGAKRLERVRFIGAFRPAGDGQRFIVPMRDIAVVKVVNGKVRRTALRPPGYRAVNYYLAKRPDRHAA